MGLEMSYSGDARKSTTNLSDVVLDEIVRLVW